MLTAQATANYYDVGFMRAVAFEFDNVIGGTGGPLHICCWRQRDLAFQASCACCYYPAAWRPVCADSKRGQARQVCPVPAGRLALRQLLQPLKSGRSLMPALCNFHSCFCST